MSGIRARDTKPELVVRSYLHGRGLRFRLAAKDLPGKPDVVFPKFRTVVFVHGCFWHRHPGCRFATRPASNEVFWERKFEQNVRRDERTTKELQKLGWRVRVIWECELSDETKLDSLYRTIANST